MDEGEDTLKNKVWCRGGKSIQLLCFTFLLVASLVLFNGEVELESVFQRGWLTSQTSLSSTGNDKKYVKNSDGNQTNEEEESDDVEDIEDSDANGDQSEGETISFDVDELGNPVGSDEGDADGEGIVMALNTTEQIITNNFLKRLSKYVFPQPLPSHKFESDFPADPTLMSRLQNGKLTPEEENAFRGKRLVILGDSVDAYIFGQIFTCIRKKIRPRSGFTFPRKKQIQCTFQKAGKGQSNIDMMIQGIFEKYDFEIVLHRASYGVEPSSNPHGIRHRIYQKGSKLYKASTLADKYRVILEDSLEYLPDKHRADIVLFNLNLWIRQSEVARGKSYTQDEIKNGLSTYIATAKEFFTPKAMGFHTIPEVRAFPPSGVTELNQHIRQVARKEGVGLFDWNAMAANLPPKDRLRDSMHPSKKLNDRFGSLILAWCLEVFKAHPNS